MTETEYEMLINKIDSLQKSMDGYSIQVKDVHARITNLEVSVDAFSLDLIGATMNVNDLVEKVSPIIADIKPTLDNLFNSPMMKMLGGK